MVTDEDFNLGTDDKTAQIEQTEAFEMQKFELFSAFEVKKMDTFVAAGLLNIAESASINFSGSISRSRVNN